jgi:hypothetical protein
VQIVARAISISLAPFRRRARARPRLRRADQEAPVNAGSLAERKASMNSRRRLIHMSFSFLSALLLLSGARTSAAPPQISGTYKITEHTDLGSQVRITVELNLINPTTTAVTVTKVGLRSMSTPSKLVSATSNLVVHSKSHSQVSLQFLLPKKDFNTWYAGPQQQFLVTMKPGSGNAVMIHLPLLRTQG